MVQFRSKLLLLLPFLIYSSFAFSLSNEIEIPVGDQEFFITRYPAEGNNLVIWIAPGYGSHERTIKISEELANKGIEVWHVDLADSLFLPKNTSTMRAFNGKYVASLIDAAYKTTGKDITLLTRSYGALPLLRGARRWQQRHVEDNSNHLKGAILFSPELYHLVPALGLPPVYSDITYSTNIPMVIYQAGKRGNRWQFSGLLNILRRGGAEVFFRLKKGVIGLFYSGDVSTDTQLILKNISSEIKTDIDLLNKLNVPKSIVALKGTIKQKSSGLDISLKKFIGNTEPLPLSMVTSKGQFFARDSYQGKVTVVNFWASWCPPCVEEIPSLNNLRKKMQNKPFELISVNYAESEEVVKKFLERVNVDFPVLLDETGKVSADWRVLVYPSTFIITPSGKIAYGVNGGLIWDSPEVVEKLNSLMSQ